MLFELFEKLSEGIGIAGVILLLLGYYLLNTSKMSAHSLPYQFLNFFGASFILFSLCFHWNTSSVLIEFAWIMISAIGIYRIFFKRNKNLKENA